MRFVFRCSPVISGLWLVLAGLLALGLCPGISSALVIHVPGDQPTIQGGLDAAAPGDMVLVACGTYAEHDITMRPGVYLRSENGDPACTIIDAHQSGRVMHVQGVDGAATIEGFTITGGSVHGGTWFEANGGGMLLQGSSPVILNCRFTNNVAQSGGGGIYLSYSSPRIQNCFFSGGSSIDGPAIYANISSPEIVGCTMYDNRARVWGGGIYCQSNSSPHLRNCTIVGNRAFQGGGIWCVANCYPVLENCVVAFASQGEGVYVYENHADPSAITMICSDVFGNAGGNYGGDIDDQTGLNGNIALDPLFCDSQGSNFRPSSNSPCAPPNNDCGVLMGSQPVGCDITGLEANGALDPALEQNAPNPFDATTEIRFLLPAEETVSLQIFDPAGRLVLPLLADATYTAGAHSVTWDGRDRVGRLVPSGTYFYRLDAGSFTRTGRMSLIRR